MILIIFSYIVFGFILGFYVNFFKNKDQKYKNETIALLEKRIEIQEKTIEKLKKTTDYYETVFVSRLESVPDFVKKQNGNKLS